MDERIEKAKVALEDKAFVEKLLELEDPEAVQALYAEKGVDLTLDEVKLMGKLIAEQGEQDELTVDDLEDVAGGIAITTVTAIIGLTAVIIDIGTYHKKKYKKCSLFLYLSTIFLYFQPIFYDFSHK